ncbi:hypothetical protein HDK77DRAFT_435683 [Phyllosticta capitalensis]
MSMSPYKSLGGPACFPLQPSNFPRSLISCQSPAKPSSKLAMSRISTALFHFLWACHVPFVAIFILAIMPLIRALPIRRKKEKRAPFLEMLPPELRQKILAEVCADIGTVDSTTTRLLSTYRSGSQSRLEVLKKITGNNKAEYAKFQPLLAVSSTIRADMEIIERQWLQTCPMDLALFTHWLDCPQRDSRQTLVLAINPQDFFENPPKDYERMARRQSKWVLARSKLPPRTPVKDRGNLTWYYMSWVEAIRRLPSKGFDKIILCDIEEPNPEVPGRFVLMHYMTELMFEALLLDRTRSQHEDSVYFSFREL